MDLSVSQRFRITAQLLLSVLASELYKSHDYSLWEIVRNAVMACMPPGKKWVAGVGNVEICLREHPLVDSDKALVVLDYGSGFTEDGFKQFFTLGASMEDVIANPTGSRDGGGQKRIGRFAAFAINRLCYEHKDGSTGFFVLTRQAPRGAVMLLPVIPNHIEETQSITPRSIAEDAPEMGFLKGIKGSFTAIVIAHPVFASNEEIRSALMWRLPRRKAQMFKLSVGGEVLQPPALASQFNDVSPDGTIEMHLERAAKEGAEPGVWFTDCATGLRVACARNMSASHVPWPYYSPDLSGDIIVPGLLSRQDTSRSGLSSAYLRTDAWKRVTRYLVSQSERVRGLLGEGEPRPRSPVRSAMAKLIELCNQKFGAPEVLAGEEFEVPREVAVEIPRVKTPSTKEPTERHEPVGQPRDPKGKQVLPKLRPVQSVRIGDTTYRIVNRSLDKRVLVMAESGTLYLNSDYDLMPTRAVAQEEHLWSAVFLAIAHGEHPDNNHLDKLHRASELRRMLFK